MKRILLALLLLFPSLSRASSTPEPEPTSRPITSVKYSNTFNADEGFPMRRSEGIVLSYSTPNQKTKLSVGFGHSKLKRHIKPETTFDLSLTGFAQLDSLFFDFETSLGEISYVIDETRNIYDISAKGEWIYFSKQGTLREERKFETSYDFNLLTGVGMGISVYSSTKKYTLYLDRKEVDSLDNPASDLDTSGMIFFVTGGASFRISFLTIDAGVALPFIPIKMIKAPMLNFAIGMSL